MCRQTLLFIVIANCAINHSSQLTILVPNPDTVIHTRNISSLPQL